LGLTNGTEYAFTIRAKNIIGTGPSSGVSASVTPATVPGAPTMGLATAGNGEATIAFTAPASNGGSAITSYTATSNPGAFTGTVNQANGGTITVVGLTDGTEYSFTVKARNTIGEGAASSASNLVVAGTMISNTGKLWMAADLPSLYNWYEAMGACPSGFRLPSRVEWDEEMAAFSPRNITGAYSSLRLTARIGGHGQYWSSTKANISSIAHVMRVDNSNAWITVGDRQFDSRQVRCIKD
jgi:hypothetical protein